MEKFTGLIQEEIETLRELFQAEGYGLQKVNALCDLALKGLAAPKLLASDADAEVIFLRERVKELDTIAVVDGAIRSAALQANASLHRQLMDLKDKLSSSQTEVERLRYTASRAVELFASDPEVKRFGTAGYWWLEDARATLAQGEKDSNP
ncbi:MAG: hypothetical protein MN733_03295 [Nitrososphaera sp.]|nr:hypothetical protein [Nitrososphaera sp.]